MTIIIMRILIIMIWRGLLVQGRARRRIEAKERKGELQCLVVKWINTTINQFKLRTGYEESQRAVDVNNMWVFKVV